MIEHRHLAASLLEKRREVAGRIKELQEEVGKLRADLIHLDNTVRMLDPDVAIVETASVRRRPHFDGHFGRGEIARRCLDALREANGESITIDSIALRAMLDKGLAPEDAGIRKNFRHRIEQSMYTMARRNGLVERIGWYRNVKWRLTPSK
jgi:hypothetical protein